MFKTIDSGLTKGGEKMNTMKDTLTVGEVADMLALSKRTIYRYCKEGKLEAYCYGAKSKILIPQQSVQSFIEASKYPINIKEE